MEKGPSRERAKGSRVQGPRRQSWWGKADAEPYTEDEEGRAVAATTHALFSLISEIAPAAGRGPEISSAGRVALGWYTDLATLNSGGWWPEFLMLIGLRNDGGTPNLIADLEESLAALRRRDSALVGVRPLHGGGAGCKEPIAGGRCGSCGRQRDRPRKRWSSPWRSCFCGEPSSDVSGSAAHCTQHHRHPISPGTVASRLKHQLRLCLPSPALILTLLHKPRNTALHS